MSDGLVSHTLNNDLGGGPGSAGRVAGLADVPAAVGLVDGSEPEKTAGRVDADRQPRLALLRPGAGGILNLAPNQIKCCLTDQPRLMGASPDSAMQSTEAESPALTTWRAGSRRSRGGANRNSRITSNVQGSAKEWSLGCVKRAHHLEN